MPNFDESAVERLQQLMGDGGMQSLMISFSQRGADYLSQIKNHLGSHDYEAAQFVTHTLKGSSANVGELELSALCARLEEAIENQDEKGIAELVPKVELRFQSDLEFIKQHYQIV